MSPGILGKRVSSMRMPTVKPYWLKPPPTRPEVIASYYMTRGHALLDHPIRPDQNAMRDRQPKRPGGLEINHQLKLCRLLVPSRPRQAGDESGPYRVYAAERHDDRDRPCGILVALMAGGLTATMTSALRRTKSAARPGRRSGRPSA